MAKKIRNNIVEVIVDPKQYCWSNCSPMCFPCLLIYIQGKMHCSWCIGVYDTDIYCPEQIIWKIQTYLIKYKMLEGSITPLDIFLRNFMILVMEILNFQG